MEEGDYNGLVAVMGHLMAVKDRQTVTDEMFEPLKQTIELLKTYGQEMPEEVHTQLQVQRAYVTFLALGMQYTVRVCFERKSSVIIWSHLPPVMVVVTLTQGNLFALI